MNYSVIFPTTVKLGPCVYVVKNRTNETKEQAALWHHNSARKYAKMKPLKKLPKGVKFVPVYEEGDSLYD